MFTFRIVLVVLLVATVAVNTNVGHAQSSGAASSNVSVGAETGLPLPRFVTLRAREVNVRTGPGVRYPIDWVFQRPNLPVQVVAEFDTWRKIRDVEGTEGWVHQSMLSGRRSVIVTDGIRLLRREPSDSAATVARLEPGVVARLGECRDGWCEVEVAGIDGWLKRTEFWGVALSEAVSD